LIDQLSICPQRNWLFWHLELFPTLPLAFFARKPSLFQGAGKATNTDSGRGWLAKSLAEILQETFFWAVAMQSQPTNESNGTDQQVKYAYRNVHSMCSSPNVEIAFLGHYHVAGFQAVSMLLHCSVEICFVKRNLRFCRDSVITTVNPLNQ